MTDHTSLSPEGVLSDYEDIFENIKTLTPERRNLLIEEVLSRVKDMISAAIAEMDPARAKVLLGIADNSLNLAGLANATNHDETEEWTSTGDKQVKLLWNRWIEMITDMVSATAISPDDLPEDTAERFATGQATSEDIEIVKSLLAAKGIEVPEDADIQFGGAIHAEDKPKGTGLYL